MRYLVLAAFFTFLSVANTALAGIDTARSMIAQNQYAQALVVLTELADANDGEAMHMLGHLYSRGLGIRQDDAQALAWFYKAAESGYLPAMREVARRFEAGIGTPPHLHEAYRWRELAEQRGDQPSALQRILMLETGRGALMNAEQALNELHSLAEDGYAPAQTLLASRYLSGTGGVRRSDRRALALLRSAVEQDHGPAHLSLGIAYLRGWGVRSDEGAAAEHFRHASRIMNCEIQIDSANLEAAASELSACGAPR